MLLVFYNSKNLTCIGALSFYDSKMSIGEVLFTTRRGVLEKSFLQLKEFELYWVAVIFFLFTHFHDF